MPAEISKDPTLPVIFFTYKGGFELPGDIEKSLKEMVAFKRQVGGHVYRIINLLDIQLTFGDMVSAMGLERGREGGSEDPDVTTIFVIDSEILKFGAQALREQEQYGKGDVRATSSPEEALAIVREDIKNRG